MNTITQLYQIDGKPMPVPDENVEMSFEDLDSSDSGRDESGVMHRFVVRQKVGTWSFSYSHLTQEEYGYLLSILPTAGCFSFTHPSLTDSGQSESCMAYLSGYSVTWQGKKNNAYRNLKFSIIQC